MADAVIRKAAQIMRTVSGSTEFVCGYDRAGYYYQIERMSSSTPMAEAFMTAGGTTQKKRAWPKQSKKLCAVPALFLSALPKQPSTKPPAT